MTSARCSPPCCSATTPARVTGPGGWRWASSAWPCSASSRCCRTWFGALARTRSPSPRSTAAKATPATTTSSVGDFFVSFLLSFFVTLGARSDHQEEDPVQGRPQRQPGGRRVRHPWQRGGERRRAGGSLFHGAVHFRPGRISLLHLGHLLHGRQY